ncbi:glycosyltransferase family 4 protein [Rhodocytophaga rosea]|uniref:Glycosyltransferase family 4 protein n=1 Tax=Rhodocytophaga rosea TaxID=2704465 RepID=A0A6C0GSU0_9BACT|nr:glycosyltransferase family 4 protein [Rhodocytophaga rosea]QHT70540.1 glycosyltransferase family 4 protein [Rhodocytophaga rosea]
MDEFKELAPTYVYQFPYPSVDGFKGKLIRNWNTYLGIPSYYKNLKNELLAQNVGLIYANGIGTGVLLDFLSFLNCKVISHIHELEIGIQANGSNNLALLKKYTSHYIAVSKAVKHNLISKHTIPEKVISLVYEFVPVVEVEKSRQLFQEFEIPETAFIIGAAGSVDIRKGADLLILLAKEIAEKDNGNLCYFIWVGNKPEEHSYFLQDIYKLGLEKNVVFTGLKKNPLPYFNSFDVFVLLSREDPYPLVCLENALLSKPILCFDQSGGMPEFVENDCGFVVPYLDIKAMAAKIIELQSNSVLKTRLGNNARRKATDQHNVHVAAPKILDIIYQYCNELKTQ